jgi:hypothetical protein
MMGSSVALPKDESNIECLSLSVLPIGHSMIEILLDFPYIEKVLSGDYILTFSIASILLVKRSSITPKETTMSGNQNIGFTLDGEFGRPDGSYARHMLPDEYEIFKSLDRDLVADILLITAVKSNENKWRVVMSDTVERTRVYGQGWSSPDIQSEQILPAITQWLREENAVESVYCGAVDLEAPLPCIGGIIAIQLKDPDEINDQGN